MAANALTVIQLTGKRRGRIQWAVCLVALITGILNVGESRAQAWQFNASDDGSFFVGGAGPETGPGFFLVCGERSPQGLSPGQTGNMEPDITPPDSFRVYLNVDDIGPPNDQMQTRSDVLIVVGTTGYRFPQINWNELFATWETDVQATDPMFQVIAAQPSFELRSNTASEIVTANGFGRALAQLTTYCQSMFASIGLPWSSVTATPTPRATMRQIAEAAVRTGCGGLANTDAKAFLSGDIDGDSEPDIVVDWNNITCTGGYPRPFCGASMCSANVYLSAAFPSRQRPEELLAQGVRLVPLDNGNMGVATGGSLASCQAHGTGGCEFIWYWNGQDLVSLN